MLKQEPGLSAPSQSQAPGTADGRRAPRVSLVALGLSLGSFLSITYLLCVLFDLWLPAYAMNSAWGVLLPGFVWLSWPSLLLGLVESFAYGLYIALFFGFLYNFFSRRAASSDAV
ncbi:MAG: DUF5676 family membrane protein [Paracoccaceae bacterium]